jgi:hypothetical protein
MGDLVGHQRAADAGMFGPAGDAGLEEGAIDDQLTAAVEQVEQARCALRPVELVVLVHSQPRHPTPLGGQRVTGAGQLLLLDEQLLARRCADAVVVLDGGNVGCCAGSRRCRSRKESVAR